VNVIDVSATDAASALQTDQTVVVSGGLIIALGPSASTQIPSNAEQLDGRGKYLIPGLWDAHTHISYTGEAALPLYVSHGITSVRDLGGVTSELVRMRRRVQARALVGPEMYISGTVLEGAFWLDRVNRLLTLDAQVAAFQPFEWSPRIRVASVDEARKAVDSVIAEGGDMIKFRNMRGDEFRALAGEARRRGIPLIGHAPQRVPLTEAADSGMRSIEHVETVLFQLGDSTPEFRHATLRHLASRGTAITPTLVVDRAYRLTPDSVAWAIINDSTNTVEPRRRYLSDALLKGWRFGLVTKKYDPPSDWAASHQRQVAELRLAHRAGVPILVGTDLGVSLVYPGSSVHEEMQSLTREAGLSPFDVLRGATILPARSLNLDRVVGRVASGFRADMVLLSANPLADIAHAERIAAVIQGGRVMLPAELVELRNQAARIAASGRAMR
jgi:imidazolonepropionase-like amidohydrolase